MRFAAFFSMCVSCLSAFFALLRGLRCLRGPILLVSVLFVLSACSVAGGVLHPKGVVTAEERRLLFDSVALMMIVVIPVIIMSFAFAWRYRASHKTSEYRPDWSHSYFLETIWWLVPCAMIVVLSVLVWKKSHQLDPYRKLDVPGNQKPLVIEAVALQWKWLFIYPQQGIATVNTLALPQGRQVEFLMTADAPMSALFIPQLAGQIYAMAGMRTRLHLYTTQPGTYQGLNAQYNGKGFSDMRFKAHVVNPHDFAQWVAHVQAGKGDLTVASYGKLVQPSEANPPSYYAAVQPKFFERIMMQYTRPGMRMH
jgi:cytochrome o ubiquinol oxidase subunit II